MDRRYGLRHFPAEVRRFSRWYLLGVREASSQSLHQSFPKLCLRCGQVRKFLPVSQDHILGSAAQIINDHTRDLRFHHPTARRLSIWS